MGNLGCQPTHRRQFFRLQKLLLGIAQRSFHFKPPGQVYKRPDRCNGLAVGIVDKGCGKAPVDDAAVLPDIHHGIGVQHADPAVFGTSDHPHEFMGQSFRVNFSDMHLADDFFGFVAESGFGRPVPDDDVAFHIGGHDGIGRAFNDFIDKIICFLQFFFHQLSLGLVHIDAFVPDHVSLLVVSYMGRQKNWNG